MKLNFLSVYSYLQSYSWKYGTEESLCLFKACDYGLRLKTRHTLTVALKDRIIPKLEDSRDYIISLARIKVNAASVISCPLQDSRSHPLVLGVLAPTFFRSRNDFFEIHYIPAQSFAKFIITYSNI